MNEMIPNFRDRNVQGAVKSLFLYSTLILLVPLGSMFLLKSFLFEGVLGWKTKDSMMYSAVIAVILVHAVLVIWIRAAYQDTTTDEKEEKQE